MKMSKLNLYLDTKGKVIVSIAMVIGCIVLCVWFANQAGFNPDEMPSPELNMNLYENAGEVSVYIDPVSKVQYLVFQNEYGIAVTPRLKEGGGMPYRSMEGLNASSSD